MASTAHTHEYAARVIWTGDQGTGTASYTSYGRDYRVAIHGKPDLRGSANAAFRGDPERHDPEDLLVTAVSACHMLAYLALCARNGVRVLAYEDHATGILVLHEGGGHFEEVRLAPVVTIPAGADAQLALRLHEAAHERCFIANSCAVPIVHDATVTEASELSYASPMGIER